MYVQGNVDSHANTAEAVHDSLARSKRTARNRTEKPASPLLPSTCACRSATERNICTLRERPDIVSGGACEFPFLEPSRAWLDLQTLGTCNASPCVRLPLQSNEFWLPLRMLQLFEFMRHTILQSGLLTQSHFVTKVPGRLRQDLRKRGNY
jgi:hypothetical protein